MSYRHYKNPDKNLVFAEYFNDESSTRKNLAGLAYSFANHSSFANNKWITSQGSIGSNNDYITTDKLTHNGGQVSVRVKIKFTSIVAANQYFVSGGRDQPAKHFFALNSSAQWFFANWNVGFYVDTVSISSNSVAAQAGVVYDVVGVTDNIDLVTEFTLGCYGDTNRLGVNAEIDFFEIYNKALTEEEIYNLHNDLRYTSPELEHDEQLGVNLVANGTFDSDTTGWSSDIDMTISAVDGRLRCLNNTTSWLAGYYAVTTEIGKRYRIRVSAYKRTVAGYQVWVGGIKSGTLYNSGTYSTDYDFDFYITATATTTYINFVNNASNQNKYSEYDNVKCEEVIVEGVSKILHVTSHGGVTYNTQSGKLLGNIMSERFPYSTVPYADGNAPIGIGVDTSLKIDDDGNIKVYDNGTGSTSYIAIGWSNLGAKKYHISFKLLTSKLTSFYIKHSTGGAIIHTLTSEITKTGVWYKFDLELPTLITSAYGFYIQMLGGVVDGDYFLLKDVDVQERTPDAVLTNMSIRKEGLVYMPVFNGSSSKVGCGDYSDPGTKDLSFISWIEPVDNGQSYQRILSKRDNNVWIEIFYRNSNHQIEADITSDYGGEGQANALTPAEVAPMQEFTHFAATWCYQTKTWKLYINGELVTTDVSAIPTSAVNPDHEWEIGYFASTTAFKNIIDESIAMYGILSGAEVSQHYTATKHLYGK